jgi:6-pyruvoyl tetrahydropterin synthase/QueD family protein
MTYIIEFQHNFETAHRLPFLGGKCENLHGHSWLVTFRIEGDKDDNGIVAEYTTIKGALRNWIDDNLDHGCMLGKDDNLRDHMTENVDYNLGKVYIFGEDPYTTGLPWPTVENVATMLASMAQGRISDLNYSNDVLVVEVRVQEQAYAAKNAVVYKCG